MAEEFGLHKYAIVFATSSVVAKRSSKEFCLSLLKKLVSISLALLFSDFAFYEINFSAPLLKVDPGTITFDVTPVPFVIFEIPLETAWIADFVAL